MFPLTPDQHHWLEVATEDEGYNTTDNALIVIQVVWWHISGEVDKFTTFWCSVSSGLHIPKIIEIGPCLTELF